MEINKFWTFGYLWCVNQHENQNFNRSIGRCEAIVVYAKTSFFLGSLNRNLEAICGLSHVLGHFWKKPKAPQLSNVTLRNFIAIY